MTDTGENIVAQAPNPTLDRMGSVRASLVKLADRMTRDHIEMGALLWEADQNQYYKDWGYDSFVLYVEGELDFKRRKAEYLRRLYQRFVVDLGVDKDRLVDIKWTKAALIEPLLTEGNVDQWMNRAQNSPYAQLKSEVREARIESGSKDPGTQPTSSDVTPLAEALEEYEVRSYALYPKQKQNVDRAFEMASGTAKSDKPGHLLDMICLEFLAGRGDVSVDQKKEAQTWINNMKKRLPDVTVLAFMGGKDQLKTRLQMMLTELESEK